MALMAAQELLAASNTQILLTVPLYNDLAQQKVTMNITLGTPPQPFSLQLDTGSTDIWVALPNSSGCAPNPCPSGGFWPNSSTTIVNDNIPYIVHYGLTPDLTLFGEYYNDTVSVGSSKPYLNTQFAVADVPPAYFPQGMWGIFGLGIREAVPFPNETYTPLWQRISPSLSFSLWLNAQSAKEGSITFGAEIDHTKYTGPVQDIPIVLSSGVFTDWVVNLTSVARVHSAKGNETKKLLTAVDYSESYILDSGSPNMYIPSALYRSVVEELNVTMVNDTIPYVHCSLRKTYTAFLEFQFASASRDQMPATIRVPYSEIIYPFGYPKTVQAVKDVNGAKMCYFGAIANDGPIRLLGDDFMRSAYIVFDLKNMVVRMAQSQWVL